MLNKDRFKRQTEIQENTNTWMKEIMNNQDLKCEFNIAIEILKRIQAEMNIEWKTLITQN